MARQRKLTIGFFTESLSSSTSFQSDLLNGVAGAAQKRDVDLIVFSGGTLQRSPENRYGLLANVVFDFAKLGRVDGLVIGWSAISSVSSMAQITEFVKGFSAFPIVTIGSPKKDWHNSLVDNKSGIRDLAEHLIVKHGKKKIAFVRGPIGSDADERYEAYKEALAAHGIPQDERLSYVGKYLESSGREAVAKWLGDGLEFDAVMAANDGMGIGAAKELQDRGKLVPDEVAVVGFDDVDVAKAFNPPFSTVMQPTSGQAFQAAEMLIDLLEGKAVPMEKYLNTQTVIRQSCGCLLGSIEKHRESIFSQAKERKGLWYVAPNVVLESLWARLGLTTERGKERDEVASLAKAFAEAIATASTGEDDSLGLFRMVSDRLSAAISAGSDLKTMESALVAIRAELISMVRDETQAVVAEKLIVKADLVLMEMLKREAGMQIVQEAKAARILRNLVASMSSTFDLKELAKVLDSSLPGIGIPSYYISVFEPSEGLPPGRMRLILASRRGKRIDIPDEGIAMACSEIVPRDLLPDDRVSLATQALVFNNELIGMVSLELLTRANQTYDAVFSQLNSSIQGSLLLERNRKVEEALQKRNKGIQDLVTPMIERIRHTSTISQEKMASVQMINERTQTSFKQISMTNELIGKVATSAKEMADIIGIIDEISTTINLVALNASIEATHAGHFGAGFSVIGKEIKKLAESTSEHAEKIGSTLKTVIENIRLSSNAGKESIKAFSEQEASVEEVMGSLKDIANNMATLSDSSLEILNVMESK